MSNIYLLRVIPILGMFITFAASVNANLLQTERENSLPQEINSQPQKKESLPSGITKDWLNSLTDERGERITPDEDPEGDAFQSKIFSGLGTGYRHGYSVSSAGDVNGDGYDDIIIGAYSYSSNTGRAYLYYGGQNMNTTADIVMTGAATSNYFGYSVSTAGDVNGDGYSDVIVGAYGYGTNVGRAYIYFGGNTMDNVSDVILFGTVSTSFGNSVSSAGDVNGDGYSDVIVGNQAYTSNTGRASIYYGGSIMNSTVDVTLVGEATNNFFGCSVSKAGDVNGDGFGDVIVGAYGYSSNTGRSYIYHGGSSMNNTVDVVLTGDAANNYFGSSVSEAGDVDGDGYSDVIVGAYGYLSNLGGAYIFIGASAMGTTPFHLVTGEGVNNLFGFSVSSAGDVNGDGFSDVIVGAIGYSSQTGRTYVYFGGVTMKTIPDALMTGSSASENFGRSVASCDVNGDGYSDIIVGAEGYNASTGRAYLFDYYMKNEITADLKMTGEAASSRFGVSVSSAGDVNSDGYSDIIVGAEGYNSNTGRAYVFLGGPLMDIIPDLTMTGAATSYFFGTSVSSAGDVNGDGYDDVIVGAVGYDTGTGRAYIYYGGAVMNNVSDVVLTGVSGLDYFGSSVSSAGDLNGDGYSDVIVGAKTSNSSGQVRGSAYIYYGGAVMNNSADLTLEGYALDDYFGNSVSSGDLNNDGYSDVIVGAPYNDAGASEGGSAYIYFGGLSMNSEVDLTMSGVVANGFFGNSVSSAGDVNNDGYSDVLIGAHSNDPNGFMGRAFIYQGGISMDNIADLTMSGDGYFGYSVSSAGDVNGDGFSDVIVGAHWNAENGFKAGKAFVYLGGIAMDNNADVVMRGDSNQYYLGCSVSSAGDLNGDGYSDIICGAYGYKNGTDVLTGRALTYFGSAISAKPVFKHVKDVPNDQGGKVNLKWTRSSFDVNGINKITDYYVEMSDPPSGGNFAWMPAATVPAVKNSFYALNINTPYDSSALSTGNFYFRITARTLNPSEYWRSGILFGRSIDNIAPLMVSPFTAVSEASNVRLNWKRSTAQDLMNYVLFRSASPTIDPYTEPPFATLGDSTYLDTSPLSGLYYYFIVAQDIHNNYSPVAVAESPNITINATMFIEGFYNASSNLQVSDTITAELHNTVTPFAIVDQSKAIVSINGNVVLKFGNAPSGTYYLVLKHRNSIETWSANGVSLTSGGSVNYDFSTSSSQAFGNNMQQVDASPVRFAIFSGDVNQDGVVDASDNGAIDNGALNFDTGYLPTDLNGDEIVDASDATISDNNSYNFVSKVTP